MGSNPCNVLLQSEVVRPDAGRFIGRDPLGFVDDVSLYRGFSLSSVDRSGMIIYPRKLPLPKDPHGRIYGRVCAVVFNDSHGIPQERWTNEARNITNLVLTNVDSEASNN